MRPTGGRQGAAIHQRGGKKPEKDRKLFRKSSGHSTCCSWPMLGTAAMLTGQRLGVLLDDVARQG